MTLIPGTRVRLSKTYKDFLLSAGQGGHVRAYGHLTGAVRGPTYYGPAGPYYGPATVGVVWPAAAVGVVYAYRPHDLEVMS